MPKNRWASLLRQLLVEIEADCDVLAKLIERRGAVSGGVKEWGAWLAEKVSRLKLKQSSPESLGTFEALEFLVLGIHGKWVLWRALNAVAASDSRLAGVDFDRLATRAESQRDRLMSDDWRLRAPSSARNPNEWPTNAQITNIVFRDSDSWFDACKQCPRPSSMCRSLRQDPRFRQRTAYGKCRRINA
jgi:hypothetical protein